MIAKLIWNVFENLFQFLHLKNKMVPQWADDSKQVLTKLKNSQGLEK